MARFTYQADQFDPRWELFLLVELEVLPEGLEGIACDLLAVSEDHMETPIGPSQGRAQG